MTEEFQQFLETARNHTNDYLKHLLHCDGSPHAPALTGLLEAAEYSLINGGKRIRPILVLGAAHSIDSALDTQRLQYPCAAIEMLHTYSLIHDDLPAMDDDDMRRGRPSLHKAYGESTAILVGDGLQAKAFELLARAPGFSAQQRIQMIETIATAAGQAGMVGGQYIDICATGSSMNKDELSAMHSLKTGALIRAALALGGIAAEANEKQLQALEQYGQHIGLAFQVVDDILDVEGDSQVLGKTSGKDRNSNKPTYVSLLGLDGTKAEAVRLKREALDALSELGSPADTLRQLAQFIVERDR